MNTTDSNTPPMDDRPFVIEGCGDSLWDDVLNQPAYDPLVRPPLPPFTFETARQKVQMAEIAWNTRDPETVSLACTLDTEWRDRNEFVDGQASIRSFLVRKWEKEFDYTVKKELWSFHQDRIAVMVEYEWHDQAGQWYRSYGNELWEFAESGLMQKRFASMNDLPIHPDERRLGNIPSYKS